MTLALDHSAMAAALILIPFQYQRESPRIRRCSDGVLIFHL